MSKVARAKSHLLQKMQNHSTSPSLPQPTLINPSELDRALNEGLKDGRFGVWSKPAKIALLYLANTKPRFSMSTESAKHIEAGLTHDYPELMQSIQEKLSALESRSTQIHNVLPTE